MGSIPTSRSNLMTGEKEKFVIQTSQLLRRHTWIKINGKWYYITKVTVTKKD